MVSSVEKRIAEIEMDFLHLQQNIDIPEITLQIHPHVQAVIKQCAEENVKVTMDHFADIVNDKVKGSVFLNQLQSGVNRWTREIQKVKSESHIFYD